MLSGTALARSDNTHCCVIWHCAVSLPDFATGFYYWISLPFSHAVPQNMGVFVSFFPPGRSILCTLVGTLYTRSNVVLSGQCGIIAFTPMYLVLSLLAEVHRCKLLICKLRRARWLALLFVRWLASASEPATQRGSAPVCSSPSVHQKDQSFASDHEVGSSSQCQGICRCACVS